VAHLIPAGGVIMSDGDDLFQRGLAVRRKVLGDAHVDRSLKNATGFDRDFQTFVTQVAWGSAWTRPGLDHKTRSLLTIVILTALGREDELRLHIRASRNTGVGEEELREALIHAAVYAGVPAANTAFRIAREVLAETKA
jgi:4-carboxymuconolactone decarboxylase